MALFASSIVGMLAHSSQSQFGPPKSAAGTRKIPIPDILVNTLPEWRLACPPTPPGFQDFDLVFPNRFGRPIIYDEITKSILETLIRAGLASRVLDDEGKPVLERRYTGAHAYRHFFCSWCVSRKVDGGLELPAKIVQQRLGHSSISPRIAS